MTTMTCLLNDLLLYNYETLSYKDLLSHNDHFLS